MAPYAKVLPVKDFLESIDEHLDALAENGGVILIERNGVLYRIELATNTRSDIWAKYDANRASDALKASAGVLKGVDLEELKRDVRSARGHDPDN
jgi:hypothetical protein